MEPLVSVLVLTYNHENFLAECLESVIAQTYKNWEVIVVDDGSPDGTLEVIRKYEAKHNNITGLTQENVGPFKMYQSYNKAVEIAKGEYLAILDGDDYWYPNKLELQIAALNKNPNAVVCWGCAQAVDGVSRNVLRTQPKLRSPLFNNNPVGSIAELLYENNYIPALTIVAKTSAVKEIGGFQKLSGLPLVDYPTLLELSLKGEFSFVDQPLGAWRMYSNQVTKSFTVDIKKGLQNYAKSHYLRNIEHPALNRLNWNSIEKKFKKNLVIAHSRAGRYKLIKKDYKSARADYFQSLKVGGLKALSWKVRSLIGILFSYLKLDVEGLAKLLNKTSYGS